MTSETAHTAPPPEAVGASIKTPPQEASEFRVFIGNLPDGFTSEEVITFFSTKGTIKSLKYDNQKNFAFLGYASEEDAKKALLLHGTKMKDNVLRVEAANAERPVRGYRSGNRGRLPRQSRTGAEQTTVDEEAEAAVAGGKQQLPGRASIPRKPQQVQPDAQLVPPREYDKIVNTDGTEVRFYNTRKYNSNYFPQGYKQFYQYVEEATTRSVFVGNLHPRVNKFILARIFIYIISELASEDLLVIKNSFVTLDHKSLQSKGFGYLEFETSEQAAIIVQKVDEYISSHCAEAMAPSKRYPIDPANPTNPTRYLSEGHLLKVLGRVLKVSKAELKKRSEGSDITSQEGAGTEQLVVVAPASSSAE